MLRVLLGLLLVSSCGTTVSTLTTTGANILGPGIVEKYAVPAVSPRGSVEVTSYGVTRSTLHLRLVISNVSDDVSWTFDSREQVIAADGSTIHPANTAVVAVPPGGRRAVDLYFPEPKQQALDAIWTLRIANRRVTERTELSRPAPPERPAHNAGEDNRELLGGSDSYRFPW